MAPRQPLNDEQRRLLKIAARMPLASVANLAPVLDLDEERVRRMLGALRRGGWVTSVMRGMTERRQHRWFLTRRAVDLLYVTGHQHPAPREEARAAGLVAFHPEGELPEDYHERFALDHDHPAHLEDQGGSPFAAGEPVDEKDGGPDHEHPPWTATSRGVEMSLRRLAMLEPVYRLAPGLIRSGRVNLPAADNAASREARMTDFRLLRHGGFYHAVARYGVDVWTPFTYAGLHATERVLRRKEQHRFWGVDGYSHEEDRYLRIGNRLFYENPDQAVEPSGQIVVAADAWARELARNTLSSATPTLFCTPDGQCSEAVDLRPSRDLVSDPSGHPTVGRPEQVGLWLRENPDMEAIDGRTAHRLFMTICQFPAMRASWLREVVVGSSGEVSRHLKRFVDTGLVAVFDGRHYLSELGMRRAANMSRVMPSVIRSRHGAYLDRWYREHEQHHNDGVNRLVVRFARGRRRSCRRLAGRGQRPRPDPGAARPAGAGQRRRPGRRDPLHRVRADGRVSPGGGVQAGALPPDGGGPRPAAPDGLRDGPGAAELSGRRRGFADADRHPGAGPSRPGDRRGHGVEQGRGPGGAPLPDLTGAGCGGIQGVQDVQACGSARRTTPGHPVMVVRWR